MIVHGVAASSVSNDLLLQARPLGGGGQASKSLSVVKVVISLRSMGSLSRDNSASSRYPGIVGSSMLGPNIEPSSPNQCVEGVEIVGTVTPSDWTVKIELRRSRLGVRVFGGRNGTARQRDNEPTGPETSAPQNRDDDPQSDSSGGKVYDFDAPGVGYRDPEVIGRLRLNLHQYAVFASEPVSSTKELGHLDWYARVSCMASTSGPALAQFVTGVAGRQPGRHG